MFIDLKIKIDGTNTNLNVRYIIADTLESKGLGEVIEEGAGEGYIFISIKSSLNQLPGIKSVIETFNLLDVTEITCAS